MHLSSRISIFPDQEEVDYPPGYWTLIGGGREEEEKRAIR